MIVVLDWGACAVVLEPDLVPLDAVVRVVNPAPERVVAVELAGLPAVREPRAAKVADVLAGAVLMPSVRVMIVGGETNTLVAGIAEHAIARAAGALHPERRARKAEAIDIDGLPDAV